MSAFNTDVPTSVKQPHMIKLYGPEATYSVSSGRLTILQANLKNALMKEFPNVTIADMRNKELATQKAQRYLEQSQASTPEAMPAPGDN